ncbi:hypothetical protein C0584_00580 [Candidatus Parcubacteria bacterium]|nr:MAG: hypothetical protein C0584_00580 [Candidatus Parcubacteria bacterium]
MDKYHHEMQIDKHLHLAKFLKDKYNDLLMADVLRLLALSMISLFVPIFLIESGFSIFHIAFFELGIFLATVPMHYFILSNINNWGVKRTLTSSYFVNILFYIVLFCTDILFSKIGMILFLVLLGFLNVVAITLYWTAHHVYFISSVEKENAGKKLAIMSSIPTMVAIISPFLGSILITNFNFQASFVVSSLFLLIASFFLFFSEKIQPINVNLNIREIFDRRGYRKNIIYVIQGMGYSSTGLIWPLLLFYLSVKLISMGVLYLFSNLAYAIIANFSGRIIDKNGSHKIVRIGAAGHGLSMILRAFATTIISLTTFQTMGGIFGGLVHLSLNAGFFRWSKDDVANRIMNREVYLHVGRFFSLGLFAILLFKFSIVQSLISVLVFAGILTFFLTIFISKESVLVD